MKVSSARADEVDPPLSGWLECRFDPSLIGPLSIWTVSFWKVHASMYANLALDPFHNRHSRERLWRSNVTVQESAQTDVASEIDTVFHERVEKPRTGDTCSLGSLSQLPPTPTVQVVRRDSSRNTQSWDRQPCILSLVMALQFFDGRLGGLAWFSSPNPPAIFHGRFVAFMSFDTV